MSDWIRFDKAIPVSSVQPLLPNSPGKYAFFIEDVDCLPEVFAREARTRPEPRLIYIGKADVGLAQRVWHEECQHRRPGTFFRSIGAMLGLRSPRGGRNYEFAPHDTQFVIEWIAKKTENRLASRKVKQLSLRWRTSPHQTARTAVESAR